MGKSSWLVVCALGALLGFVTAPVYGAISASATISSQQISPSLYEYSLTLTNTGSTNIGTLWYAWFPAYDLLPHAPTSISSPAGWTGVNAPDDFGVASVQWVNTLTPLQPGDSLSGFKFDSQDSPAVLAGTSFFGQPIQTSYVYIGAPETDPGAVLIPTAVTPEPTLLPLLLAPFALLQRTRRRQFIK